MTKEEYIKFVKDSYKEIFKDKYNEKRAMDSADAILVESDNDVDKAKAAADVIIARTKAKMDASQKNFDNLSAIKDMLFDAPVEVKEAFNDIVSYFDFGKNKGKDTGNSDPQNWAVYVWEWPDNRGKGTPTSPYKECNFTSVKTSDPKTAEDWMRARVEKEKGGKFIKFLGLYKDAKEAERVCRENSK